MEERFRKLEGQQNKPTEKITNLEKSLDQKIAAIMTSIEGIPKKLIGEGNPKSNGGRETRTCHYCQKVGHLAKDCYK